MLWRLAIALHRTPSEVKRDLTTEEWIEAQEWFTEPRGDERADYHAAQIVAAILNCLGGGKKGGKKFDVGECLLRFKEKPKRAETPEAKHRKMQFSKAAFAGQSCADGNDPEMFAGIEEMLRWEELQRREPVAAARQGKPKNKYTAYMDDEAPNPFLETGGGVKWQVQ